MIIAYVACYYLVLFHVCLTFIWENLYAPALDTMYALVVNDFGCSSHPFFQVRRTLEVIVLDDCTNLKRISLENNTPTS